MSDTCYITEKPCEYWNGEECLAVFIEQCPIGKDGTVVEWQAHQGEKDYL